LKRIAEELQLDADDIVDRRVMFHGDYLTVRNITRAMFRRVVEPDPMLRFVWIEPIAGLFHLQMNVLKLLMHALEGSLTEPGLLKRFETFLCRKGVNRDVKDLHACDDFFRIVLDCYVIAYYMHNISKKYFHPGGMAPSEWTRSVRAVRDTPVADHSAPGVNSTRRVPYRPLIAVSPFLLVLSVSYFKRSLWRCG